MDVFSVSCITGFCLNAINDKQIFKIATSFGAFHTFMLILGWVAGSAFVNLISGYDHWVAFLLLLIVGGKMLISGIRGEEDSESVATDILEIGSLLMFSVAVSIDSVAVGLSFSLEKVEVLIPSLIIGLTAFIFTFIGVKVGCSTGSKFGKWAQIFGGIILISIGLRVLISHIFI
jgi:putative Mn2+ efflux pump MntP